MAKNTALFGKVSGKIGAVVFSTSGGEIVSREYNPHVANPNTQAQVNQRARLKLMSQLSAALAPVIAMTKDGLVSARNQFVKKNFAASYASDGLAQITYENVQITSGNAGLPSIVATRALENGISIQLAEDASSAVDRVVYIMYRKTSEQSLQLVQSIIVEGGGVSGTFPGSLVYTEGDLVFYAYGMKDLNANASAAYGNLSVASAVDVARLVATRKVDASSYQFTQTRGATMYADENEIADVPEGSARVFVTAFGGGSVSGGGVKVIGENATVVATPNEGYTFSGWKLNGTNTIVSHNATYTFEVQGTTDLVAVFEPAMPGSTYNITLQVSAANQGAITAGAKIVAGGQEGTNIQIVVQAGDPISAQAVVPEGFEFINWQIDDNAISSTENLSYTPQGNVTIVARYKASGL